MSQAARESGGDHGARTQGARHPRRQARPSLHIHPPGALLPQLRKAQAVRSDPPAVALDPRLLRRHPGTRQQPPLRRPHRGARRPSNRQGLGITHAAHPSISRD